MYILHLAWINRHRPGFYTSYVRGSALPSEVVWCGTLSTRARAEATCQACIKKV